MKPLTRIALPAALLLAACGDDITEINSNVGAVESSLDLPKCTDDIAGQTAFVKETHEFLGCDGKEWLTLSANTVSVGDNICTSTSLSDGTGFEIFCNGQSIGTVKNGKDGVDGVAGANGKDGKNGADGKDGADGAKGDQGDPGADGKDGVNGTGCRIAESTALTATIACGSETFTMDLTGYVELPAECDTTLYAEDCTGSLDDVTVSGVSQKGPFAVGADITAYELENGRSLKQTGKTFGGKIERADGTFDIKTVKLKSMFAYLVADGFYLNEVTGEKSATSIKLRALTNLQGRATANINLMTHLEYDRIQHLVTKEDSTVMKAKKAAEREIFAAFGINNAGFKGYAEDYNVLKEGDGNAALLAVSVLLQGDRTEAELSSLLASLSVDLGDNGEWDNQRERTQVADWAMKKTLSREGLAAVRANVEGWGMSDGKAPAFEGHVIGFWQKVLEIGECSSANEGAIKAVDNKYSVYYAQKDSVFSDGDASDLRLICAADGESYAWRAATDIEKNTAAIAGAGEGVAKRGAINPQNVYVFEDGKWRRGTELDSSLSSCVAGKVGATDSLTEKFVTTWYVCDKSGEVFGTDTVPTAWREANAVEADTAGFGVPAGDTARVGNVNKSNYYVFEDADGDGKAEWRYGTERDVYDSLGGPCTRAKLNTIVHLSSATEDVGWYKCAADWAAVSNGVAIPHAWREATALEADTAWINARAKDLIGNYEKIILKGNMTRDSMNYYVHVNGNEWRRADTLEMDTYDTLNHMAWPSAVDGDFRQGAVTKRYYVYEKVYPNNLWRLENSPLDHDPDLRGCTYSRSNQLVHKKIGDDDSLHYVCLGALWQIASSARLNTEGYSCTSSRKIYAGLRDTEKFFTCESDTFRVITKSEEWAHNVLLENARLNVRCGPRDEGLFVQLPHIMTRFVCKNGKYVWDGHAFYWDKGWALPIDKDGNEYEMVSIGTQFWLIENLRVDAGDQSVMPETVGPDSLQYFGRLYRYDAAVQACEDLSFDGIHLPTSYRLPTMAEWNLLLSYETDKYYKAHSYKSKSSWLRNEGDDKYLFNVVAAGDAVFESSELLRRGLHHSASFWSKDTTTVGFEYADQEVHTLAKTYNKQYAESHFKSVRCIGVTDIPPAP
jgi:uncharacterized protein (TIGR02145 family)